MKAISNIILSRTDSIGDMILALPMAKILKENYPHITIAMLGKKYTRPVAAACKYADAFIDVEDFLKEDILINGQKPQAIIHLKTVSAIAKRAFKLKIPVRVGTAGRLYHWKYCNRRVWFSRKNSHLHEAQLNLKLLKPFRIKENFSLKSISESYGLTQLQPLENEYLKLIKRNKYNVIIHPKSQGNGREWSMQHFIELIQLLDDNMYNIFISGTENERTFIQPLLKEAGNKVIDITGSISLEQFIPFINECDGVVANSTGPLHIAAALGKDALGLYAPFKTKNAERWGPVGKHAVVFELNKPCAKCINTPDFCYCINAVQPALVKDKLDALAALKHQQTINNSKAGNEF